MYRSTATVQVADGSQNFISDDLCRVMSFQKVLIANRGEIAVRIIRACRELDLSSVAVYSDADANALHVQLADESVHIGASEARSSYLDGDKLVQAALSVGAGAIHPGYGFLAENTAFAQACADAGLVFVGPSPQVIASMGAKIEAKRIAESAGVSCVPGYHGDDQSDANLLTEAERIGVPLLIKASAGGGGRGMRRVDDLAEFATSLSLAREEAKAAFGDAAVLLERFVEAPRHIEVQILGDHHGNVRHLYERDCSVQRNYQKVIEEAPAPNLPESLRQQMLQQAVALAKAIGYSSAGTVEFVVDAGRGEAYFLEMNTRLQVEHPVTEMITGIDLAAWQLRIALGEAIDFAQEAVQCKGWAMEARLAAEDPAANYQAQTGTIRHYTEPDVAGLRVDSGIRSGSVVSPYYDSMLAKLIVHAQDRNGAIRKLRRSLNELNLAGVGVNRDFLHDILALDDFRSGKHLTSLLASSWPEGWQAAAVGRREQAEAILVRHLSMRAIDSTSPWQSLGAWRLGEPSGRLPSASYYLMQDEAVEFQIVGRAENFEIACQGEQVLSVSDARLDMRRLCYRSADQQRSIAVSQDENEVCLHGVVGQPRFTVFLADQALIGQREAAADAGNAILAPTPGQVVEVLVSPGDQVEQGQPVMVLEAMKMLQQLCAGQDGLVCEVSVQAGDAVNSGDGLLRFADQSEEQEQ